MPRITLLSLGLLIAPVAGGHQSTRPQRVTDYTLQIENTMGHEMDFSYSDADSTEHSLGSIPDSSSSNFPSSRPPARPSLSSNGASPWVIMR